MEEVTTLTKEDREAVEDKAFAEAKKIDTAKLHARIDDEFDKVNEKLKERQALLSKQITDYMESVKM